MFGSEELVNHDRQVSSSEEDFNHKLVVLLSLSELKEKS